MNFDHMTLSFELDLAGLFQDDLACQICFGKWAHIGWNIVQSTDR